MYFQQKATPYEGGVRVPAAIWSPLLKSKQRVSNSLYHVSDILPTLLRRAGVEIDISILDGFDIWNSLQNDTESPRHSILHNIDGYEAYTKGHYKIIKNQTKHLRYTRPSEFIQFNNKACNYSYNILNTETNSILSNFVKQKGQLTPHLIDNLRTKAKATCNNKKQNPIECDGSVCIYNVYDDPCEYTNLAGTNLDILHDLESELMEIKKTMVESRWKPHDVNSNPEYYCGRWTWWKDEPRGYCGKQIFPFYDK